MDQKTVLFWVFLALVFVCFFSLKLSSAETTGELIKRQIEHISRHADQTKGDMVCRYGVITGNILKGNSGRGNDSSSLSRARNYSFGFCDKYGGGCEELFSIFIHNDTPREINIYIFHPFETDFSNSNALWLWTWEPGHANNLGVYGVLFLVSKRFYLKAEATGSGGGSWGLRRIEEYNWNQRNYSDGQNLRIRLIQTN